MKGLFSTFVSFMGVIIIINPFSAFEHESILDPYLLLPILAAFTQSCGNICLHEMRGKFNQYVVLQYTYVTQIILSGFLIMTTGTT